MSYSANGGSNPPNPQSLATPISGGKRMKTVLDLIGEFAVLHDAKVMWGGKLPNEGELYTSLHLTPALALCILLL